MEEKASSASMALDKHRTMPGSDETQKSAEESIMEEKKESKRPPIKLKLKLGLLSGENGSDKSGDTHCSTHGKTFAEEHPSCDECKYGHLKPVVQAASKTESKSKVKDRLNPVCAEGALPRFYAAQAAAARANAEQATASQPVSPATRERQKYLRDKGLRVRFSEEVFYRSRSPSAHEDEDEDETEEETARSPEVSESTTPDCDIADYIAWSNSVKNKYGHARPGTFDYFRAPNAGTVSSVERSYSTDDTNDPNDHGWARMLKLPQRKRQSIARIDYSRVQKAASRGSFSLDGADDDPDDHDWASMLRLPRKQHAKSHTVDYSSPQAAITAGLGRSSSLDGVRDPNDRGWAQKLNLRSKRQQQQDEHKDSGQLYMVPAPDQTVNDEQPKILDPAHLEHLQHTSEYHKAITDVHQNTHRRLEQPHPQVQPQHHASRPSIRSPFNLFKRDNHQQGTGYDAPDVVRSPVQGPIQAPARSQGQGQGQGQGYARQARSTHGHRQPANIPSSFKGAVLSPDDLSRARSRYREHTLPQTLPQPQQPYVGCPGPGPFVSSGSQFMRHPNVPITGSVRSLGVIDKTYLGPQYQTPAGAGQYPASAYSGYTYPGFGGTIQNPGMPAPVQTQYYQAGSPGQYVSPGQYGMPPQYYQSPGPGPSPRPFMPSGPVPSPMHTGPGPMSGMPMHTGAGPFFGQAGMQSGVNPMSGPVPMSGAGHVQSGVPGQMHTGPSNVQPVPMNTGPVSQTGPPANENVPMNAGPSSIQTGTQTECPNKYTQNPNLSDFGAPPRAFIQTTASQRHPSAVFPGQIKQTAPVEHYNSTGVSGAFAQTTPSQQHPSSTVSSPHTQTEYDSPHGIQAGPRHHRPAATQKALPPSPPSQQSSPSHVSSSSSSQVLLPATRYMSRVNSPRGHFAHRRSVTTGGSHGQGQGQPHFFRPDFTTMDPVSVQGHGRDVMVRDASFFLNRDRDVGLQNLVADRTVASTGQSPFSSNNNRPVRPRGADRRDRWAGQNLEPQEEQMIASALRQPAQRH